MVNTNGTKRLPVLAAIYLMIALVALCRWAGAQPVNDMNGDKEFNRLDYWQLITSGKVQPFKDLLERFTPRKLVLPPTFEGTGSVTRIDAKSTMRGDFEVREIWFDRTKISPKDKPANGTFSSIAVRSHSGGHLFNPTDPKLTLPLDRWSTQTFVGTSEWFGHTDLALNTGVEQVVVEWAEVHSGVDETGTAWAKLVYPRSPSGTLVKQSLIELRPSLPNYTAASIEFRPKSTIVLGERVTPVVTIKWTAKDDAPVDVELRRNGTVDTVSIVAEAGTSSVAIGFPSFTPSFEGTFPYEAIVKFSGDEKTKDDNKVKADLIVKPVPPPYLEVRGLKTPKNPRAGQTLEFPFEYEVRTTKEFEFVLEDNQGWSAGPFLAKAGSTISTFAFPLVGIFPGKGSYGVSIMTTVAMPIADSSKPTTSVTYEAPIVDWRIVKVVNPTSVVAGLPATATVTVEADNVAGPINNGIFVSDSRDAEMILGFHVFTFPAGTPSTVTTAVSWFPLVDTTGVTFILEPLRIYGESDAQFRNNVTTIPVQVTAPDLAAVKLNVAGSPRVGETTTVGFQYQIKSLGFKTKVVANLLLDGGEEVDRVSIDVSPTTTSGTIPFSVKFLTVGSHKLTATIDADAVVTESNEKNNSVTATVNVLPAPLPPGPPSPRRITVTPGNGQLVLSWSPVSGATGYEIGYGSTLGTFTTTKAVTTTGDIKLSLVNNVALYGGVRSVGPGGKSTWSNFGASAGVNHKMVVEYNGTHLIKPAYTDARQELNWVVSQSWRLVKEFDGIWRFHGTFRRQAFTGLTIEQESNLVDLDASASGNPWGPFLLDPESTLVFGGANNTFAASLRRSNNPPPGATHFVGQNDKGEVFRASTLQP